MPTKMKEKKYSNKLKAQEKSELATSYALFLVDINHKAAFHSFSNPSGKKHAIWKIWKKTCQYKQPLNKRFNPKTESYPKHKSFHIFSVFPHSGGESIFKL